MAKKADEQADQAKPAAASGPADPAPATELTSPSGAIIEPEIATSVDLSHESVDANPRADTTAAQNAIDWNDTKRARPQDDGFAGEGLDASVYGQKARR